MEETLTVSRLFQRYLLRSQGRSYGEGPRQAPGLTLDADKPLDMLSDGWNRMTICRVLARIALTASQSLASRDRKFSGDEI